MAFLEISPSIHIHYEESGAGRPVVLLHGWAMSGRVWAFQQDLARQFRVIQPDLRGHGKSTGSGFSLNELAEDLCSLLEALNLERAVVVGWSMGSQVAIKAFTKIAHRVSALVLVGATARFTSCEGYDGGLPGREVKGLESRLKRDYERTMGEFFRRMFSAGELSRERENRIAREVVMGSRLPPLSVALAGLELLAHEDLLHRLPMITCPVLVIHGDEDTICPPASARVLAARIPDARLKIFARMGHSPFLSHPDQFNQYLHDFIRGVHDPH